MGYRMKNGYIGEWRMELRIELRMENGDWN